LTITVNDNLYSDDYNSPYINICSTILSKNSDIPGINNISNTLTGITNILTGVTESLSNIDNSLLDIMFDVKHILGLSQQNYRLNDHIYDEHNRLTSVSIKIFCNKFDCNNNINSFSSYTMNASYDSNGLLVDYKVIKN